MAETKLKSSHHNVSISPALSCGFALIKDYFSNLNNGNEYLSTQAPFDEGRLVFPPVAAMVFALPFYIFFIHALPLGIAQGLFGGGLLGYLIYDMTHYYLHHGQPSKGSYFHMLKQYHVQHHFVDQNKGYLSCLIHVDAFLSDYLLVRLFLFKINPN